MVLPTLYILFIYLFIESCYIRYIHYVFVIYILVSLLALSLGFK